MNKIDDTQSNSENDEKYWRGRAVHYDKLFWTKDEEYLNRIIEMGDFKKTDLVLDVGVGSGAVAKKIQPLVKDVIGLDISESMLNKAKWNGFSLVKWNICDALFTNNIFDKVVARMVFHHIIDNLDIAIMRCYDLLKTDGKIIVAEGVPPSEDSHIVKWFSDMFKLKEERLTFSKEELIQRLKKAGFKEINAYEYVMRGFSVKNWLINSGLDKSTRNKIMKMHLNADKKVQDAYNIQYVDEDCLIDTKNIILVGTK